MMIDLKRILLYVVLACGFSWPLGLWIYLSGQSLGSFWSTMIAVLYMFGPALAAIIVQKFYVREDIIGTLGIKTRWSAWYLVAWLFPILFSLATLWTSTLVPGVSYAPGAEGMIAKYAATMSPEQVDMIKAQMNALPVNLIFVVLLSALVAGPTINTVAAFGEELGWRGFLFKELSGMNFWSSSLLIGFIWGLWHWPLIIQGHNYPEHPELGIVLMVAWTMLLSPLMQLVRIKTKSVWSAAIFHGSLNAAAGLPLTFIIGGSDITVGVTGLAGFAVLLAANLCVWIYLRYNKPSADAENELQAFA